VPLTVGSAVGVVAFASSTPPELLLVVPLELLLVVPLEPLEDPVVSPVPLLDAVPAKPLLEPVEPFAGDPLEVPEPVLSSPPLPSVPAVSAPEEEPLPFCDAPLLVPLPPELPLSTPATSVPDPVPPAAQAGPSPAAPQARMKTQGDSARSNRLMSPSACSWRDPPRRLRGTYSRGRVTEGSPDTDLYAFGAKQGGLAPDPLNSSRGGIAGP
jgi:hypothetical protein